MTHHDLHCSTDVLNGFTRNCCTTFPACRFENWMGRPQELCNACDQWTSCPDMAGAAAVPISRCHQHAGFERQHCLCGCANARWSRRIRSEAGDTLRPTQSSGHSSQRQFQRNPPSIRSTFMSPANMARICPSASDPTREVDVYGWYLTRAPSGGSSSGSDMDPSVAIGGFKTPQRLAEGFVQSGRVELRLESRKVRTVDGMTVCLKGMINLGKSVENGFPPTLVRYFIMGFPTAWIYMMMSLPTMTNCGRAIRYPWMSELAAPSDAASPSECLSEDSSGGKQGAVGETTISVDEATGPNDLPVPNQGSFEASLRTDYTGAARALDEDSLNLDGNADEMPPVTTTGHQSEPLASQSEELTSDFLAHENGEVLLYRPSSETTGRSSRSSIRSGVENISTPSECNSQDPNGGISTDCHSSGDAAAIREHGGMTTQQAQTSDAHATSIETQVEVVSKTENATLPAEIQATQQVSEVIKPADADGNSIDDGSLEKIAVTCSHSPEKTAPLSSPQNASPGSVGGLDQGSEAVEASDKMPEDDNAPSNVNLHPVIGGIPPKDAEGQMVLESKDESQVAREDPAVTDHPVYSNPIPELLDNDEGMNSPSPSTIASGAEPSPSSEVTGKSMKRRCRRLSFVESSRKIRNVDPDLPRRKKTRMKSSKSKQSSGAAEDNNALKDDQAITAGMQTTVEEEDQNHSQGLVPRTPVPKSKKRKAGDGSPGEIRTSATATEKDPSEALRKSGEGRILRSGRRLPVVSGPDEAMSGDNGDAEQDIKELGDTIHTSAGTQPDPDAAERVVNFHATMASNSHFAVDCRHNSADGNAEAGEVEAKVECVTSDVEFPNDAECCNDTNLAGSFQIKKRRRKGFRFYKSRKRRSCSTNSSDLDPSVVCEDPPHPNPAALDVDSNEANITIQPRETCEQAEASIVPPIRETVTDDDAQTEAPGSPPAETKSRKENKSRKCRQELQDETFHIKWDRHRNGGGLIEERHRSASFVPPARETAAKDGAQTEAPGRPPAETKSRGEQKSRTCGQALQDEASHRKRDSHRNRGELKLERKRSSSFVPPARETVAEDDAQTEAPGGPPAEMKSRMETRSRKCRQASQDEARHTKRDSHRNEGGLREQRNRSSNVNESSRHFMIPPPLPTPLVLDKSQVTQAYGLKKSRHGRVLVPPLAVWCNQSIKYDMDGSLIAISAGTRSESEYSTVSYDLPSDKRAKLLQRKFQRAADVVRCRK